jgi:hypothetical protein
MKPPDDWAIVPHFSERSRPQDEVFDCLDTLLSRQGIPCVRLETASASRALIVDLESLLAATRTAETGLAVEGRIEPGPSAKVLFFSPGSDEEEMGTLLSLPGDDLEGVARPGWLGVTKSPGYEAIVRRQLSRRNSDLGPEAATLTVAQASGSAHAFALHALSGAGGRPEPSLKPGPRQIGEGPDNLAQRGRWFRNRTGGSR